MPKKAEIKMVAFVAVGVVLGGWAMAQFRDVGFIAQARDGYGA